jgi:23S rRNA pseudouridine1911/1915/1917 synthase
MASLGYPVAGDLVYNRKSTGTLQARKKLGLIGQALHARRLSFMHPQTGEQLSFEAPLPADFQAAIENLS